MVGIIIISLATPWRLFPVHKRVFFLATAWLESYDALESLGHDFICYCQRKCRILGFVPNQMELIYWPLETRKRGSTTALSSQFTRISIANNCVITWEIPFLKALTQNTTGQQEYYGRLLLRGRLTDTPNGLTDELGDIVGGILLKLFNGF